MRLVAYRYNISLAHRSICLSYVLLLTRSQVLTVSIPTSHPRSPLHQDISRHTTNHHKDKKLHAQSIHHLSTFHAIYEVHHAVSLSDATKAKSKIKRKKKIVSSIHPLINISNSANLFDVFPSEAQSPFKVLQKQKFPAQRRKRNRWRPQPQK